MDNGTRKQSLLRFGVFELNVRTSELRKNGALVKLQSQPVQILALLAAQADEIVSREEIRGAIWGEETFVDFDRSINFCVNQIRRALDDDPQSPRYIETVPRQGYRFIAPIESGGGLVGTAPNGQQSKPWRLLVVSAAAVLIAATWGIWRPGETKPIQSLAVLPLENLSHDPEQDYFADGMTDDLITDLAKISALRVISRTSVAQYKDTKKPVGQIARELSVDAVLEGTVMRERDRVRITAQLIRAAPEKHLWADKYEGSLSEVLGLQDEVAQAVAHEIRINVTPREQAVLATHRTINPEAYDAYLRGRNLHPSEENLPKSLHYFEQAIEKDPGYALAWAWLAETHNLMADLGLVPRADAAVRARSEAERAFRLDNTLGLAVVALAVVKQEYELDWAGAEREFKRAMALDPNNASAHLRYAEELWELRRNDEAIAESRRSRDLAPFVYEPNLVLAWSYYIAHQYPRFKDILRRMGLPR